MLTTIWSIIIFFVLITVHELGHFVAAKLSKITVLEFALGMGPAIFKKEYGGTLYSLRILPIGGYCKMEGEDTTSEDTGAFSNKGALSRLFVLVSGALMNIVLGFVVFCIMMAFTSQITVPVIESVVPSSAAQQAGLMPGDRITKVNNTKISTQSSLNFELSRYKSGEIKVEYLRNNQKNTVFLTPTKSEVGNYIIGFLAKTEGLTFGTRITNAYHQTIFMSKVIIVSLGDLITGKISFSQTSGPVGIVSEIGNAAKQGSSSLLFLVAMITINLGIFNLLPIPALDGGRIFFILIEMVRRKKIPPEREGIVHLIGFALLIALMLFATSNDIFRLIGGAK